MQTKLEWTEVSKDNCDVETSPPMRGEWCEQTDFVNSKWVLLQVNKEGEIYLLYELKGIETNDPDNPFPTKFNSELLGTFPTMEDAKLYASYVCPK